MDISYFDNAASTRTDPRVGVVEMAVQAESDNKSLHAIRAEVYQHRRGLESSLMAKGIFGAAANESREHLED